MRVKYRLAERLSAPEHRGRNCPQGAFETLNTKSYEAFYIVSPSLSDADVQKIADKFKAVVEAQGGTVEKAGKWEKRKLAYEVNGLKEANYVLMHFEAGAAVPAELRRQMRNSDDIVRHMILDRSELK